MGEDVDNQGINYTAMFVDKSVQFGDEFIVITGIVI
jgi:hypothetical protein